MSEINYELLRLDVLQKLIDERGITCKNKKDEIIKYLIMDDEGKYIRETTYERNSGGYIVGIDMKNKNHMIQIGNLIIKKEARNLNRYSDNRLQYWSSQKLV
jgi:hypothetical protein